MGKHDLTVKFGPVLGPLLERTARVTGRSKNAIVREAVERHLAAGPPRERSAKLPVPFPWLYQRHATGFFLQS